MCDALNDLEAFTSEKEHDVVLLPPASGNKEIESDEEDIDDEALSGSNLPQEVPGEIEIHQIDSGEDEDEGNKSRKTKTFWKKSESLALQDSIIEPPKVDSEHAGKRDINNHNFMVTEEDICQFLGLILISGYHNAPSENDYWSTAEDMQAPIFSRTMSRDNFRTIKRYFRIAAWEDSSLEHHKELQIVPEHQLTMENETTIYSDIVVLQKGKIHNQLLNIDNRAEYLTELSNTETDIFHSNLESYPNKWLFEDENFDEKDFTSFTSTFFKTEIKSESEKQMVNDHNVQPLKSVDVTNENLITLSEFNSVDEKLNSNHVNKLLFSATEENTELNDTAFSAEDDGEISISNDHLNKFNNVPFTLLNTTMDCISSENNASVISMNVGKSNLNDAVVPVLNNHLRDQKSKTCLAQNLSLTETGEGLNGIHTNDVIQKDNLDSLISNTDTNTNFNKVADKLEKSVSGQLFDNQTKQTFNNINLTDIHKNTSTKENAEKYLNKDILFSNSSMNNFNETKSSQDLKKSDIAENPKLESENGKSALKEYEKKRKIDNMCTFSSSTSTNTKQILQLPHINSEIGKRPRLSTDGSHSIPDLNVSSSSYVPTINLDFIADSNYNNALHFNNKNQNCTITSNNINCDDNYNSVLNMNTESSDFLNTLNNEVSLQTGETESEDLLKEMLTNKQCNSGNIQDELNMSSSNYIVNNKYDKQKVNNELLECDDTKFESITSNQNLSSCINNQDYTVMDMCHKIDYNYDKEKVDDIQYSFNDASEKTSSKGIDNRQEKEIISTFINKLQNSGSGQSNITDKTDKEFLNEMNKLKNEYIIESDKNQTNTDSLLKEEFSTNNLCDRNSQIFADIECGQKKDFSLTISNNNQKQQMQKVFDFVEDETILSNKSSSQIVHEFRLKTNASVNTCNSELIKTDKSLSQSAPEFIKIISKEQQPQQRNDNQLQNESFFSILFTQTSASSDHFALKDVKSVCLSSNISESSTKTLELPKASESSNHSTVKHVKSNLSPSNKTLTSPNLAARKIESDPSPPNKTVESTIHSTLKHTKSHPSTSTTASDSTNHSTGKSTKLETKNSDVSVIKTAIADTKYDSKSYSKKRPAETTATENEPNKRARSSKETSESKPGTSHSSSSSNYIDEREIADNNDPKWQLYNFSDPQDCFLAVYNQWCLTTLMPNPHEDLTCRYHDKKPYRNNAHYAIPGDKKRKDVECISIYSKQLDDINNKSIILKRDLNMYGSSWQRRRINYTMEKIRDLEYKHEQLVNAWDEAYRFYKHYKNPQTSYNSWYMSEYKQNEVKRQLDILECYEDFYGYT
ncbi:hypothetical protein ILUMI_00719 [Ignelater luminosus]|uniref:PiggyBac transposable element-derived protein domain-containing protein n=1 Tax=Ignelater luminosus TaxID=2038154 RepID=A0A8K0DLR2_IGNLU|nr:hypothetical protein ILUMI_00719 [Ignelater luminosus]